MKHFIVTLLKDLPEVKAGFSFKCDEWDLSNYYCACNFCNCPDNLDHMVFDKFVRKILSYQKYPDFVCVEPDYSEALQIQCPNCKEIGLFPYFDSDTSSVYDDGVTLKYRGVGLECPRCSFRIETHSVCVGKKVDW